MAARNLYWAELLGQLDKRQLIMLSDVAVGDTPAFLLSKKKLCYDSIRQIKRFMTDQVVESFGKRRWQMPSGILAGGGIYTLNGNGLRVVIEQRGAFTLCVKAFL